MYRKQIVQSSPNGYQKDAYQPQVEPWRPLSYYICGKGADVDGVMSSKIQPKFDNIEDVEAGVVDSMADMTKDQFDMVNELGAIQAENLKKAQEKS